MRFAVKDTTFSPSCNYFPISGFCNILCRKNVSSFYENKTANNSLFPSFCTEQYKNEKHLSGSDAVAVLEEYGVLDYLAEHYEMLHTQSHQWLMKDIDELSHYTERR